MQRWVALVIVLIGALVGSHTAHAQVEQDVVFDGAGGAAQVSLIGDSTLAGVRWYADYGSLERFNFVLNAESCRRTVELSCISREGYRSSNVLATMRSLNGQLGEVAVIMSGYNDPIDTIDEAIAAVTDEARSQGVDHVVWLTLRTSADVDYSDPQEQSSINTFREYNEQLFTAAEASDGFLQIADWATYSLGSTAWFEFDGVHLSRSGVDALTTFLAGSIEQVLAGTNISPAAAPWTVLVPGAEGEQVAAVQQAILDVGIDVPGGADGVFGYDTMASVAEYQRQAGDLQVTGAVDVATARTLGVYDDAQEDDVVAAEIPVDELAVVVSNVVEQTTPPSMVRFVGTVSDGGGALTWLGRGLVVVAVLALLVALRRRHVVNMRRERRMQRQGLRAPSGDDGPAHLGAQIGGFSAVNDVPLDDGQIGGHAEFVDVRPER